VDFEKAQSTSVLDGGKDEVTTLNLQSGKNVFLCFLTDRGEKNAKPHVEQGLLKIFEIPTS
jgi:hypothetical protein